jgi:hypothetical protein
MFCVSLGKVLLDWLVDAFPTIWACLHTPLAEKFWKYEVQELGVLV